MAAIADELDAVALLLAQPDIQKYKTNKKGEKPYDVAAATTSEIMDLLR